MTYRGIQVGTLFGLLVVQSLTEVVLEASQMTEGPIATGSPVTERLPDVALACLIVADEVDLADDMFVCVKNEVHVRVEGCHLLNQQQASSSFM